MRINFGSVNLLFVFFFEITSCLFVLPHRQEVQETVKACTSVFHFTRIIVVDQPKKAVPVNANVSVKGTNEFAFCPQLLISD